MAVSRKPDATGAIRYEIPSRLALKPGRYELRAAIEAGSNETGSVFTFVVVPDFARDTLSMSGLVLAGPTAQPATSPGAFANLLPIVPTAQRRFTRADRLIAFVRIHQGGNGAAGPVNLTTTVTDDQDRVVSTTPATLAADAFVQTRGADYQLDLPLNRLAAGEHPADGRG